MLDQLHCGSENHSSCRFGASKRGRTMSKVACLISTFFLLVVCFPASVNARTGPAGSSIATETISYREPTPIHAKLEVAELKIHNIKEMDYVRIAPPEADSIFHLHSKDGSNSNSIRRGLVGSSPPTCRYKCGSCQPCKPVHVAIGSPHGVISETEYYPEVWRCLCGNRYYMP